MAGQLTSKCEAMSPDDSSRSHTRRRISRRRGLAMARRAASSIGSIFNHAGEGHEASASLSCGPSSPSTAARPPPTSGRLKASSPANPPEREPGHERNPSHTVAPTTRRAAMTRGRQVVELPRDDSTRSVPAPDDPQAGPGLQIGPDLHADVRVAEPYRTGFDLRTELRVLLGRVAWGDHHRRLAAHPVLSGLRRSVIRRWALAADEVELDPGDVLLRE